MKLELQAELLRRHPRIFRKPVAGQLAALFDQWGIECGDGWFALIDRLPGACESEIELPVLQRIPTEHWPRAAQIKEKAGSLRFYVRPQVSDELKVQIQSAAYAESRRTCKQCGVVIAPGSEVGWRT